MSFLKKAFGGGKKKQETNSPVSKGGSPTHKKAPTNELRTDNIQHRPGSQAHIDYLKKQKEQEAQKSAPSPINRHKAEVKETNRHKSPSPTSKDKGYGKGGRSPQAKPQSPTQAKPQSPAAGKRSPTSTKVPKAQTEAKGKGKGKGGSPKANQSPKASTTPKNSTAHISLDEPTGLTQDQIDMIKQKHGKKVQHHQSGARKHGYPDEVTDHSPKAQVDKHIAQAKADINKHSANAKSVIDAGKDAFNKAKGKGKGLPAAAKAAKDATDKQAAKIAQDKNLGAAHADSLEEKLDKQIARLDKSHEIAQQPIDDPKQKLADKLDKLHNRFEMAEKAGFEEGREAEFKREQKKQPPPSNYDVNQNMKKMHFKSPVLSGRGVNSNKNFMPVTTAMKKGKEIYAN